MALEWDGRAGGMSWCVRQPRFGCRGTRSLGKSGGDRKKQGGAPIANPPISTLQKVPWGSWRGDGSVFADKGQRQGWHADLSGITWCSAWLGGRH